MSEIRFVADPALGRLARWLRLLGYDASFGRHLTGAALLAAARREGRVLLTRDTRLMKRKDLPPHLFIKSDHFREQLKQVIGHFKVKIDRGVFGRCIECNLATVSVAKDGVAGKVPPYVFTTQETFSRCPSCGKIYWRATHYDHVRSELAKLT